MRRKVQNILVLQEKWHVLVGNNWRNGKIIEIITDYRNDRFWTRDRQKREEKNQSWVIDSASPRD